MGPGVGCYVVVMGETTQQREQFPGREGTVCCNPCPTQHPPSGRISNPGPLSHPQSACARACCGQRPHLRAAMGVCPTVKVPFKGEHAEGQGETA